MNKPNDYDNFNMGGFEKVTVGPHIAVIKGAEVRNNKNGKPMLVVSIDFAQEDEQRGYFSAKFDQDTRVEKKWPYQATAYINKYKNDGSTNWLFNVFNHSYEKTNNCKIVWDEDDNTNDKYEKQFKGKKIGVMYGEVEEEYNGQTSMRTKIVDFFDVHEINNKTAPLPKYLPDKPLTIATPSDEFMRIPETDKEALPFA